MSLVPEGQGAALAALRALAARGDDAPRTLLLAGPDGVGRRDVARWYAALRGCAANLDDPCGRCPACRSLLLDDAGVGDAAGVADAAGVRDAADYREIGPATTTRDGKPARRPQLRIDQLVPRDDSDVDDPLGTWLARPPAFRHRVGTIVRAETLTEQAANAFLTTLERPPRHATLVLIAPGPDALLPTVASRCAVVRLRPADAPAAVRARLAPHPALRLGRPAAWRSALADEASTDAKRAAVGGFLAALPGDLADAFAAAEALAAAWPTGDDEMPGLLREAWRSEGPAAYANGDAATAALEEAWGAYAHRDLALRRWVLTLRSVLNRHP